MTEALALECQLRFIELCMANTEQPAPSGLDLYVEGFWAAVDAMRNPQSTDSLEDAMKQAQADGLIR